MYRRNILFIPAVLRVAILMAHPLVRIAQADRE